MPVSPAGPCVIGFVAEQICDEGHEPCQGPVSHDNVGGAVSVSIAAKAIQLRHSRVCRSLFMWSGYAPARAPALTERNRGAEWALARTLPRRRGQRAVSRSARKPVVIDDIIDRSLKSTRPPCVQPADACPPPRGLRRATVGESDWQLQGGEIRTSNVSSGSVA